jgi:hypothetical protein
VTNTLRLAAAVAVWLAWLPAPTSAQALAEWDFIKITPDKTALTLDRLLSIDQSFYYKLSTQLRGNGMKLDVVNGGPKNNLTRLGPDQDVSGQFWRFVGNADGTFRLSTIFRGPGMCLDIFNGGPNNNQPHLVKCGNFSGQFWVIILTEDGDAVRLTTKFRGPGMCLDVFNGGPNDNQPHLTNCAKLSGQLWTLTKTDKRVEGATRTDSAPNEP